MREGLDPDRCERCERRRAASSAAPHPQPLTLHPLTLHPLTRQLLRGRIRGNKMLQHLRGNPRSLQVDLCPAPRAPRPRCCPRLDDALGRPWFFFPLPLHFPPPACDLEPLICFNLLREQQQPGLEGGGAFLMAPSPYSLGYYGHSCWRAGGRGPVRGPCLTLIQIYRSLGGPGKRRQSHQCAPVRKGRRVRSAIAQAMRLAAAHTLRCTLRR